jgi:hypothetical protein
VAWARAKSAAPAKDSSGRISSAACHSGKDDGNDSGNAGTRTLADMHTSIGCATVRQDQARVKFIDLF